MITGQTLAAQDLAARDGAAPAREQDLESQDRLCPACGCDNRLQPELACSRGDWRLKQCLSCSLVYLENAPQYAELEQHFAWEKTYVAESAERRRREPVVAALSAFRKKLSAQLLRRRRGGKVINLLDRYVERGRVLDIGCGEGNVLRLLSQRFTPYGVEISKQLAEVTGQYARSRGGAVVHQPALEGLAAFPREYFDGVLMRCYLEHEVQPAEVLGQTWQALKPGGCVLVKVPNYACWNRRVRGNRWCGYRFPDHVNYFTPETLRRLIESQSFKVVRFGLLDRLPTNDSMWMVARKVGRSTRSRQAA